MHTLLDGLLLHASFLGEAGVSGYVTQGLGFCRGATFNVHVNATFSDFKSERTCANSCSVDHRCVAYAYAEDRGGCYVYGPGLDRGLPPYTRTENDTAIWKGNKYIKSIINSSSGSNGVICMRRVHGKFDGICGSSNVSDEGSCGNRASLICGACGGRFRRLAQQRFTAVPPRAQLIVQGQYST